VNNLVGCGGGQGFEAGLAADFCRVRSRCADGARGGFEHAAGGAFLGRSQRFCGRNALGFQCSRRYSLEIINTHNPEWNDVDVVDPLYQKFKNVYNITPITRLGQYWGKTVPAPGSPEYSTWPSFIANNVVNRLKKYGPPVAIGQ
jgi:hypothetical protein